MKKNTYLCKTKLHAMHTAKANSITRVQMPLTGGAEPVYYFHSDHLGSASWITDGTGAAVQHLLYLPFGEHFANERNTAYSERFTFTGKERDAETGYYYHGARFNCSDIGWLSVDPMADKYPSISPFSYCAWNPIKLVDPEGEQIWIAEDEYGNNKVSWNNGRLYNVDGSEYKGNNYFVLQTAKALDKINEHKNSSAILNEYVGETEFEITIKQGNETESLPTKTYSDIGGAGVSKYQTIKFNPHLGLYQCKTYDDEGAWLAPFVSLFHEFGHIHDLITDISAYDNRLLQKHDTYSNLEEMRIIQIYEWPLAKYYNMLKRDSHIEGVNGLEKFESENSTSIQRKK